MGAKTWMIAYVDGNAREILRAQPRLNREAASALANRLFPSERLEEMQDGTLSYTCPPDDELYIGCWAAVRV